MNLNKVKVVGAQGKAPRLYNYVDKEANYLYR